MAAAFETDGEDLWSRDLIGVKDGENTRRTGGYKVNIPGEVHLSYICTICSLLMRDPVQTVRGELACESCYEAAKGDSDRCPIDGEPIKDNEVFPDKCKNKEILSLKSHCPHQEFGCVWEEIIRELEEHVQECLFRPILCSMCTTNVCLRDIEHHLGECFISHGDGKCVYAGCNFKACSTVELVEHIANKSFYHAILMSNLSLQRNDKLKLQMKHSEDMKSMIDLKFANIQHQIETMFTEMIQLKNDQNDGFANIYQAVQESQDRQHSADSHSGLAEVTSLKRLITTIDLKQQLLDNKSCGGRLLWKIDRVASRMENAKMGRILALHSAPAFIDIYGYKFCARIFLNGDGLGKTTHVSLFFVLMKSEYDSLLTWPFKKRISMRLFSQEDRDLDVKEFFDSDGSSACFQRPVRDMNVSSGFPKFVTQKDLLEGGFVKDDCLFIEINVAETPSLQKIEEIPHKTEKMTKPISNTAEIVGRKFQIPTQHCSNDLIM